MIRFARMFVTLAALAATAGTALAAPVPFTIDRNHSNVGFEVRHFFSKVPGEFKDYEAKLMIDPENLAASSVEVTIQAASIDTQNDRRDNHLRSGDFFDVENTPTLTFKSTKVVPGEGNTFKIEGDLTMRGVTKPVVLDVENLGIGTFASGENSMGTRAGFEAKTTVDRKDFGINWNRVFDQGGAMLSDEVWITLQIEAVQQAPKAEAAVEKKGAEMKAEATKEASEMKAEMEKKATTK